MCKFSRFWTKVIVQTHCREEEKSFSKLCATEKQTNNSLSVCQFDAGMLAEGKGLNLNNA